MARRYVNGAEEPGVPAGYVEGLLAPIFDLDSLKADRGDVMLAAGAGGCDETSAVMVGR